MSLQKNRRVIHFVACAKELLPLIENPKRDRFWAREVLVQLAALYAAGTALPQVDASECAPESGEPSRVSDEEWFRIFRALIEVLGDFSFYHAYFEIADPAAPEKSAQDETGMGSLADDLADIYRDVKSGLDAWDLNREETLMDIVWHWKFELEIHWGRHAVNAMRALNELVYGGKLPGGDSIEGMLSTRI